MNEYTQYEIRYSLDRDMAHGRFSLWGLRKDGTWKCLRGKRFSTSRTLYLDDKRNAWRQTKLSKMELPIPLVNVHPGDILRYGASQQFLGRYKKESK